MSQVLTSILLLLGGGSAPAPSGWQSTPDIFTRLQAVDQDRHLGVGFIMLATAIHFQDLGVSERSLLVILFLFPTPPIAAHVIARAAYFVASLLWRHARRSMSLAGRGAAQGRRCGSVL